MHIGGSAELHRRRTQRRMARAAFARTAGLQWLPQTRKADSARDSVAVATTSSTHFAGCCCGIGWAGERWNRTEERTTAGGKRRRGGTAEAESGGGRALCFLCDRCWLGFAFVFADQS